MSGIFSTGSLEERKVALAKFRSQDALSANFTSTAGHLFELDRAGWAWEWLRRNPDFMSLELTDEPHVEPGHSLVARPALATQQRLMRWGLHYA